MAMEARSETFNSLAHRTQSYRSLFLAVCTWIGLE